MSLTITSNSAVIGDASRAVAYAVEDLTRDIAKTLLPSARPGAPIRLVSTPHEPEAWEVVEADGALEIHAGDDFGFIYGLYAISRELLGVKDLWFWNDQIFEPVEAIDVPAGFHLESHPTATRYKGFFVNDEVLLEDWQVDNDKDKPWRLVFETIYRLGGNLVIPGSGQRGEPHLKLAQDMGFYINQHHACPLGARMFATAYPGVAPQWPEQRERFEALWREAIEAQKDHRTVWTLGFRGQGDSPFWAADPRYDTDEARGRVLSEVIARQYEMVQELDPGAPCVIYLYGEAMDLYRKGVLTYPAGLTKIWADNGFGRMVSRRQGGWDPRVDAMPEGESNGIYFHASFYDLQAANHITPLCVDPRLVARELGRVLDHNGGDVWIVNSSNVKPHVYFLNLIAAIWRDGKVDAERVCRDYVAQYYGVNAADEVLGLFDAYWQAAASFGPHWDQKAGEQLYTYPPRYLTLARVRDAATPARDVRWLADTTGLRSQIVAYRDLVAPAAERYAALARRAERVALDLEGRGECDAARLLRDSIGLAIEVYAKCAAGCVLTCQALLEAGAVDAAGETADADYARAFWHAGLAREAFRAADQAMRSREHGVWGGYWRNDCLSDVKQSAMVMGQFMGWLRMVGDDANYCAWKREFTYPTWEKDVWVIMNMENHESDDEIFAAMCRRWGGPEL